MPPASARGARKRRLSDERVGGGLNPLRGPWAAPAALEGMLTWGGRARQEALRERYPARPCRILWTMAPIMPQIDPAIAPMASRMGVTITAYS